MQSMSAPFPWFGGKSRVAHLVWPRFGDVPNYVEPFAGSLAVLLGRPTQPKTETVNDKDCFLANFWRAIQAEPDTVAAHCGAAVIECDLEARRRWVFDAPERAAFRAHMFCDHEYYDAEIAGWWVWGVCATIGGHWKPLSLHLGDAGCGVHKPGLHLGDAGRGVHNWFEALSARLCRVRVKCGDWTGVISPTVTTHQGITGMFLDPPYDSECCTDVYGVNDLVGSAVAAWAIEHVGDPKMRIALCGYEGEHDMPPDWECVPWKAKGGYGSRNPDNQNKHRERIWFSPECLRPSDMLFDMEAIGI